MMGAMEPGTGIARGARILVVEDDPAINGVVCSYLGKAGATCTAAFSGTEALLLLGSDQPFDLVIADLMLPGAPGEDVVARAVGRGVAAIVLSARERASDKVSLLRIGADDYLAKPFDLDELLARVEVQLRRAASAPASGEGVAPVPASSTPASGTAPAPAVPSASAPPLRFGAWELDEAARAFSVAGAPVRLTRTEFEMVRALMAEPRRVHTKRNLSAAAGGDEAALEDKAVSTHIGNIRAKLRSTGTESYLETVWGIGFKLADDAS